jgi:hypothetical protein
MADIPPRDWNHPSRVSPGGFAPNPRSHCRWCGETHLRCPEVSAIEYHPDGSVKRVEFRKNDLTDWTRMRIGPAVGSGYYLTD